MPVYFRLYIQRKQVYKFHPYKFVYYISYADHFISIWERRGCMKETSMPPAHAANLVANSGNTIYKVTHIYLIISFRVAFLAVNSLWPGDTIWWHKSGSTLAQVMACCLMAPSHYLNQSWLIIRKVQWHSFECNFTRDNSAISHWN